MCTSHKTNVERCLLQMGTCPTKEVKVHEGRDVLEMTQGNKPNEASGQWNRLKKERNIINFNNLVGNVIISRYDSV